MQDPKFCAFVYNSQDKADSIGFSGILGDGSHRFLMCNYLERKGKKDFSEDIKKCTLDIVYLENLCGVIKGDGISEALCSPERDYQREKSS